MLHRTQTISQPGRARRGFTFVELVIGMTLTILVGAALAAFSFAMAQSWTDSESAQSVHLTASQASLRLMPVMQNAKFTGLVRPGSSVKPAAVIYWQTDSNSDNTMQASELALLQHNPDTDTIALWQVEFTALTPSSIRDWIEGLNVTAEELYDENIPEDFKEMIAQVDPSYTPRTLAAAVADARFEMRNIGSESQRPSFVYTLTISKSGSSLVEYGTATLRGATTPEE